jgi:hypothetical protein
MRAKLRASNACHDAAAPTAFAVIPVAPKQELVKLESIYSARLVEELDPGLRRDDDQKAPAPGHRPDACGKSGK